MLTDVVMPDMNGLEVADQIRQICPETRAIFMSGYTDRFLGPKGKLDQSTLYLQKPFTLTQLAEVLRLANGA